MNGNKRLETTCPECGQVLSVVTQRQRVANERPGQWVEVPIGKPICRAGHIYRMQPNEHYPE